MTNSPTDDALDGLLSDFFKAQLKNPWPAAPATPATSTPAAASAESPRNRPAAATRDPGSKARFTLAVSVALLLGTCWFLSNGFQPGDRANPGRGGPDYLDKSRAGPGEPGGPPNILDGIRENKAKNGDPGIAPPKIELP